MALPTAWSTTIDPRPHPAPETVDCGKTDNKTCWECGNTSGPTVEFCCRDPKNCTVVPAPAPTPAPVRHLPKHPALQDGAKATGVVKTVPRGTDVKPSAGAAVPKKKSTATPVKPETKEVPKTGG